MKGEKNWVLTFICKAQVPARSATGFSTMWMASSSSITRVVAVAQG